MLKRAAVVVALCAASLGTAAPPPPATVREVPSRHVMFISVLPGAFGKVGVVPLGGTDTPPAFTDLTCHRVHFASGQGVCMAYDLSGGSPPFFASTFGNTLQSRPKITLPGRPSRTRVSPSGRYAAMTVFTEGDSYGACEFSTRTSLLETETGKVFADLESFEASKNGRRFAAADFNYWGITFTRDDNRFYASLGSGGKTYLVAGDVRLRKVRVLRENVECPSLSPDGRRIAFKNRVGTDQWRLHVLDLATLADREVAGETRSIDDQAEWLDDTRVLYGFVDDVGLPEVAANIWVASVDDNTPARVFVKSAISPAVVR